MNIPPLRFGTWPHWFQGKSKITDRLREKFGCNVKTIDFKRRGYLDDIDVLVLEQNGLDDYFENNADYLHHFIANGGICWIMHQDYERWHTDFLPDEAGRPCLVKRYFNTISPRHKSYLLPLVEPAGVGLFGTPNAIDSSEFVYWSVPGNSFGTCAPNEGGDFIRSTATSCIVNYQPWQVLGSYRDGCVDDGALVARLRYVKGMFFWNQLLFPELRHTEDDRCLAFWDRYIINALNYFADLRTGKETVAPPKPKKLPKKNNYRMIVHLHSLDWYGADAAPAAIAAAMKFHNFDIGVFSVKDTRPLHDFADIEPCCDDRVLLLPGQEFHPFNWQAGSKGHNDFHILALGTTRYTTDFTQSLFDRTEIDHYIRRAIAFIRENGGACAATHPTEDFWLDYDLDAVDVAFRGYIKPPQPENFRLAGSALDRHLGSGKRIAMLTSVDMWGLQRLRENPLFSFIYLDGEPSRETVVAAIKARHLMPAWNIDRADVRMGKFRPGDAVPALSPIKLSVNSPTPLRELRVCDKNGLFYSEALDGQNELLRELSSELCGAQGFIRLEIEAAAGALLPNPFYLP
ncbi:MAG: hypothetical protein KJ964_00010 [Verrucomicrobia bacterium]|nr:hypothetical protein [Verrucomicrobiota bacterium]MBU1733728.1 hypothetical protein [Verrucomicrobiota bacterium]MBU1855908.1 hypothetical protein [Verrucomicrobiota bacterium]